MYTPAKIHIRLYKYRYGGKMFIHPYIYGTYIRRIYTHTILANPTYMFGGLPAKNTANTPWFWPTLGVGNWRRFPPPPPHTHTHTVMLEAQEEIEREERKEKE
jgi:hypothetical protein